MFKRCQIGKWPPVVTTVAIESSDGYGDSEKVTDRPVCDRKVIAEFKRCQIGKWPPVVTTVAK